MDKSLGYRIVAESVFLSEAPEDFNWKDYRDMAKQNGTISLGKKMISNLKDRYKAAGGGLEGAKAVAKRVGTKTGAVLSKLKTNIKSGNIGNVAKNVGQDIKHAFTRGVESHPYASAAIGGAGLAAGGALLARKLMKSKAAKKSAKGKK